MLGALGTVERTAVNGVAVWESRTLGWRSLEFGIGACFVLTHPPEPATRDCPNPTHGPMPRTPARRIG
jgi:hypothetical protein